MEVPYLGARRSEKNDGLEEQLKTSAARVTDFQQTPWEDNGEGLMFGKTGTNARTIETSQCKRFGYWRTKARKYQRKSGKYALGEGVSGLILKLKNNEASELLDYSGFSIITSNIMDYIATCSLVAAFITSILYLTKKK